LAKEVFVSNQPVEVIGDAVRPRTGAVTAAMSQLLMTIIAPVCVFGVIAAMTVPGDAAATAANIVAGAFRFRLAILGLIVVAALDVAIAWGLYVALAPRNRDVSLLAALFRIVYTAAFLVAIIGLLDAAVAASTDAGAALTALERFDYRWDAALIVFGLHLVLLAPLVAERRVFERILAVLLVLAGAGYIVDGVGTLLDPNYAFSVSVFTFIGEVLLIVWLFVRGGKARSDA